MFGAQITNRHLSTYTYRFRPAIQLFPPIPPGDPFPDTPEIAACGPNVWTPMLRAWDGRRVHNWLSPDNSTDNGHQCHVVSTNEQLIDMPCQHRLVLRACFFVVRHLPCLARTTGGHRQSDQIFAQHHTATPATIQALGLLLINLAKCVQLF